MMYRVYYADEFEEEIMAHYPNYSISLTQLAKLEAARNDEQLRQNNLSEDDEEDPLVELKAKAYFEKINSRPEVPGQLYKPEPKFNDREIKFQIEETRRSQRNRGVVAVMSNGGKPYALEEIPRKPEVEPGNSRDKGMNPEAIRNSAKTFQPEASSSRRNLFLSTHDESLVSLPFGGSPELMEENSKDAQRKFPILKDLYELRAKERLKRKNFEYYQKHDNQE